jgi:methylthioribose-1-phosphate isomerase
MPAGAAGPLLSAKKRGEANVLDDSRVTVEPVRWEGGSLYLLDQTRLPHQVVMERQETIQQVWDSIKILRVRGAPAIGVATAYGMLVGLRDYLSQSREALFTELKRRAAYLESSRPTASNLSWAAQRMVQAGQRVHAHSNQEWYEALVEEAVRIHEEDRVLSRKIGENGRSLIREGCGVLTHCNAGRLISSDFGTATAPMYLAHREGVHFRVYSDETRPLLQGARLTSFELFTAGIDVTLITDNMAASIMSEGLIDLVIVGADRVVRNGDAANKIGTFGVAILAKYFGIPFYVACPRSTIDLSLADGTCIPIEERDPSEVRSFGDTVTALSEIKTRNPAFDVTPHTLIAGIITDRGLIVPPFAPELVRLFGEE